jgi:hypothetical protein
MKKRTRRYREIISSNTIMVAGMHGNGRIHDFMKGFGTVAKDGKSILWDWWRPTTKKRIAALERHWKKQGGPFAKWVFPAIKNMPQMPDLREIMMAQPMDKK